MKGTYKYTHPVYSHSMRTYQLFTMRVEVVAEKGNRYQIKYLGFHASGAAVNSLHWVRKDKVRLDSLGAMVSDAIKNPPRIKPLPPILTQKDAIAAMEELYLRPIRLPYKDNDDEY